MAILFPFLFYSYGYRLVVICFHFCIFAAANNRYLMFEESIARYLKTHGHTRISLKAVLFDMDGVLFDSMPYHADAWHKVMESHGLHLSREEAYMHEGRTGAATINLVYQRQYGRDATPELIESIYAEKSAEFNKHPEPGRMPGSLEVLSLIHI